MLFRSEAQKAVDAKQKEASEANTRRLEAEKNRLQIVKEVLGLPEDMANPEILEKKQDVIDDIYGKYLEQPTYTAALEWLSASIQNHYESMKGLQAEKDRFAAEKQQLADKHASEMAKLTASKKAAESELEKQRAEKAAFEKESVKQKNDLLEARKAADERAKRLQDLSLAIEDLAEAGYEDAQSRGKIPVLPEPRKAEFMGKDDKGRVDLLKSELIARGKQIRKLNEILEKLRVADPTLQNTVRAATPKDDRVDGFDGRILSVNELDRTVLVSCGTTTGLREIGRAHV